MATVSTHVDIDIDLSGIDTVELVEELDLRSNKHTVPWHIDGLERQGVSADLIAALREWEQKPVADDAALEAWMQAVVS